MDHAAQCPEQLFAADISRTVRYKEARQFILTGAQRLEMLGVQRGDRVLVECTQNVSFLLLAIACQVAGAVFVPLEHKLTQERINEIARETEALLLVSPALRADACRSVLPEQILAEPGEDAAGKEPVMPVLEETAEILFTTGTTGKPKGIEVTHANNVALAENIAFGTEMREGNVEFIPLALSHSHAIRCFYANMLRGGSVVITDGVTAVAQIYGMIRDYRVTAMDLSPAAATVLLRLSRGRFAEFGEQIDYIQIGTAALSEELKKELRTQFPKNRLYNFYGSTEAGRSCVLDFNSPDDRPHCIGRPTKNSTVYLTDENRVLIDAVPGRTGLLAWAGPMNMKGYYKNPEETAKTMRDGIVYTNDEGFVDENGLVYVLGRRDDVINYKGIKIAPEEIESIAARFPGVLDCACIGLPDPSAGQIPVLCYSVRGGKDVDEQEYAAFLGENLEAVRQPRRLRRLEEIPRTANGKLQRGKLRTELLKA